MATARKRMEKLNDKTPLEFYFECVQKSYELLYNSIVPPRGHTYSDGTSVPRISVRGSLEQHIVDFDIRFTGNALGDMNRQFPQYPGSQLNYSSTSADIMSVVLSYLRQGDTFFDAGAGLGFACLQAIESGVERAIGIEIQPKLVALGNSLRTHPEFYLGPKNENEIYLCIRDWYFALVERHSDEYDLKAMEKLNEACREIKELSKHMEAFQGDILACDLPEASFIYFGIPLFSPENWQKFARKVDDEAKSGTRIAVLGHEMMDKQVLDRKEFFSGGGLGNVPAILTVYEI